MTIWSNKKLALSDRMESESGFFVRVPEEEEETARAVFAGLEEIRIPVSSGVVGEFAFLTPKMSEREFAAKAERISILNRIRAEWCAE